MASAHGPGTEGAGIRVCGYAIKNSGLIVEVNQQHLHVCMKEPRVKIRTSGVARAGLDGRGPYRSNKTVWCIIIGDGESGGHVLRETTSRGRCGLVCPSRTGERGGEGDCVKEGGGGEEERERERALGLLLCHNPRH